MTTHPTPDLLSLVALGEDGEPEVLEHLAGCRACFAEIEALQQVVLVGRSLGPEDRIVAPHPRVWHRVVESVDDAQVVPLPGAVTLASRSGVADEPAAEVFGMTRSRADDDRLVEERRGSTRAGRPRRRWLVPTLAAAAALVLGLGGGFALKSALDPGPDVVGATQLNALPRWSGANGTASVEKDSNGQQTLVVTMQMPPTVSVDGTFEVWLSDTRAQDMVPMGRMDGATGRFPVPPTMDLATHPIVDVSLEPTGDTDPSHSAVSVVRGRLAL